MKRTRKIYNELGLQLRNKTPKRRGRSMPPSQSDAAPLELSRPECGTVVGMIVPPDVRLAGWPYRKRVHLGVNTTGRDSGPRVCPIMYSISTPGSISKSGIR